MKENIRRKRKGTREKKCAVVKVTGGVIGQIERERVGKS